MIAVNGRSVPWRAGMTIADALAKMGYDYVHITVTVDGAFVPADEFSGREVPDRADIKAIHLHHGG
jgi:thiamine biosynthesis protein ThiS